MGLWRRRQAGAQRQAQQAGAGEGGAGAVRRRQDRHGRLRRWALRRGLALRASARLDGVLDQFIHDEFWAGGNLGSVRYAIWGFAFQRRIAC